MNKAGTCIGGTKSCRKSSQSFSMRKFLATSQQSSMGIEKNTCQLIPKLKFPTMHSWSMTNRSKDSDLSQSRHTQNSRKQRRNLLKLSPSNQRYHSNQHVANQPNLSRHLLSVSKMLQKTSMRTISRILLLSNLWCNSRLTFPRSAKKVKTIVVVKKEKTLILIKVTRTMMTK